MSKYIIQTHKLTHHYNKSHTAVDQLSIHVPRGSIYGFLGPNGAGKSTTMRLLTGILPDEHQAVEMFGQPLRQQMPEIFERMGCLVESPALYKHLSGAENLKYIAKIRHIAPEEIDKILEIVELQDAQNLKVKKYSLGMKQRLAIAMALLHQPELLLLDEPVNGLDPKGIVDIRKLLIKINAELGASIFISSHLLSEIEKLCTHTGIIVKGKLRFEGTMEALSQKFGQCRIRVSLKNPTAVSTKIPDTYPCEVHPEKKEMEIVLSQKEDIPSLVNALIAAGAEIYEVKILEGIEEWFMSITK